MKFDNVRGLPYTRYICPLCSSPIIEQRVSDPFDDFDVDVNKTHYEIMYELKHLDVMDEKCRDFFIWFCGHLEDVLATSMRQIVEQFRI